ncbi:MAG TPA: TetR/AcrR family transcriptional regulator [Sphingomonas sp.]|nr:TetR/AcrR family transcriptional regulator [Sphingomonas sp.]
MRYDRDHKAQTHARIVEAAAAGIRAQGVEAIRVGDVMARAGLTHGGFYAHFPSKQALVAEAIAQAFEDRYAGFLKHLDDPDPAAALISLIDSYLSNAHVRAPESGCPMPPLAGEVARMPEVARNPMEAGLARLVAGIEDLLSRLGLADAPLLAASVMNELVGALTLARLVADEPVRQRILASSRDALRQRLGLVGR